MEQNGKNLIRFDDFCIDLEQQMLLKNGEAVPLTPKAFALLLILAGSPGRTLSKHDLIESVWQGTFVEEGNLTFTINLIRKALGDSSREPRFIQTVPRRGYRFIGQIRTDEIAAPSAEAVSVDGRRARPRILRTFAIVLAAAIVCIGFAAFYKMPGEQVPRILRTPYSLQKITSNGGAFASQVSPDGNRIAVTTNVSGKTAVGLYDINGESYTELLPVENAFISGLTFSPDGKSLFFAKKAVNEMPFDVVRLSLTDRSVSPVAAGTEGWLAISPAGTELAFVRCPKLPDDHCTLYAADLASGVERTIVRRGSPTRISAVAFADNETIVFGSGQSMNASNSFGLFTANIRTGDVRPASSESFFNIKSISCFGGGRGCLFVARKAEEPLFGIYALAGRGLITKISGEAENFSQISVDAAGTVSAATLVSDTFSIFTAETGRTASDQPLASAKSASFTADGRILYAASIGSNKDLWIMNRDGSGVRQLTSTPFNESSPVLSPDGRSIFFDSNQSGEDRIWRMNADGTEPVQISFRSSGRRPQFSADGKYLFFNGSLDGRIYRIDLATGEEIAVTEMRREVSAVDASGSRIAAADEQDKRSIEIIDVASGRVIDRIRGTGPNDEITHIVWLPETGALLYVAKDREKNVSSLWRRPVAGGSPERIAELGSDEIADLSADAAGTAWLAVRGRWLRNAVYFRGLRSSDR